MSPVGELRVFGSRNAGGDLAFNLNHIFVPQMVGLGGQLGIFLRSENNLRQPFPISQVDEDNAAMITPDMHPAGEHRRAADVAFAEFVAMMGPVHDVRLACPL